MTEWPDYDFEMNEEPAMESIGDITAGLIGKMQGDRVYQGGKITAPGVYAGIDIERYHRDPNLFDGFSISSSGIRTILRRPLEYWWTSPYNPKAEEQDGNAALDFGKAAHMLLLGEDGFSARYAKRPDTYEDDKGVWKPWNGNSKACKEWLAKTAAAGKIVITGAEIDHIRKMRDALQNTWAIKQDILNGRIERSIFHKDGDIWLKARPDVIPNASGDFVDLKTAASVDDESLSKAIYAHGYHVQAGFMRMIVREVLGAEAFSSFTFVFVEKVPPYDVRVMQLKDSDIDLGERQARRGISILRQCIARNEWPGFDGFESRVSYVEMPSWAATRINAQLNSEAA